MESSIIPRYTYSDYIRWKGDWELIRGYPFQLSHYAKVNHNKAIVGLLIQIESFLSDNKTCTVFAQFDWKINEDTVVRPDVMIACSKIETDYLEFPPILIAEIITDESQTTDRNIKFDLYRENGVKYYIMCDYIKRTNEVFELIDNVYRSVSGSSFDLDKDCLLTLDFNKIF